MEKRIDTVNAYIQKMDEVKLSDLEKMLPDVSAMTLRRDLEQLEKMGEIIRIRGGARSIKSLSHRMIKEENYLRRRQENPEGKKIIGQKAAELLTENENIYIDSGTTAMCLAENLPDMNLSVLTGAPNVAIELTRRKKIEVTMIGGQLSRENFSVSGVVSVDFVKNTNINTAFISTSGFSLDSGFTAGSLDECEVKKAVISKAKKVVLMLDNTKIDKTHMFTFAGLDDIDIIVSDTPLPPHLAKEAKAKGIKII
ncbi:MAG: DeoR/GlpR family DNA-binding transcription regulator [Monoglobales bacterium]